MAKVSIIGTGNVGHTAGQCLAMFNKAHIVFIDIADSMAAGKALDILQTGSIVNHSRHVLGSGDYADTADSDIVVITAGVARKPNMSRDDLLKINASIVKSAAEQAVKYSPDAIFIVVTNPLDVMTQLVWQTTGLPRERVIGMAGVLDSARFQTFIADELEVSPEDVRAMVLGGHGDLMVPLVRHSSVNGIPLTDLVSAERIEALSARTRDGGAEIVKLLKTGSAFFAPGASVALMVEAILNDSKRLVPCSVLAPKSWGLPEVFIGLPVVLGKNGVERVVDLKLSDSEKTALLNSAKSIEENVGRMNELLKPAVVPNDVLTVAPAASQNTPAKEGEKSATAHTTAATEKGSDKPAAEAAVKVTTTQTATASAVADKPADTGEKK